MKSKSMAEVTLPTESGTRANVHEIFNITLYDDIVYGISNVDVDWSFIACFGSHTKYSTDIKTTANHLLLSIN